MGLVSRKIDLIRNGEIETEKKGAKRIETKAYEARNPEANRARETEETISTMINGFDVGSKDETTPAKSCCFL